MSCYNSQATIGQSVESILNQSYENFELLICDDGSIDSTFREIEKYSKADKRISIFKNEKNIGLTKSLNLLINKSDGEFIARQDDDDISLSHRIETRYIKMIDNAISNENRLIGMIQPKNSNKSNKGFKS